MRFYNRQHTDYCGIDLHVKTMYVCMLDATGQVLVLRQTCSRAPAARQPAGTGKAQIRWSIDPNRRRVRWLSANSSQ